MKSNYPPLCLLIRVFGSSKTQVFLNFVGVHFSSMNDLYFACPKCQCYTDAGYRWAYWALEKPGLVSLRTVVDVESILKCDSYWNPPDDERNGWLVDSIFPTVHRFLEEHQSHGVIYIESDDIFVENSVMHNWVEIKIGSFDGG